MTRPPLWMLEAATNDAAVAEAAKAAAKARGSVKPPPISRAARVVVSALQDSDT